MSKPRNITNMSLMKSMCATCPFGPNGDQHIRCMVEQRVLTTTSQLCHSSRPAMNKPDTRLCRGARDWQLQIFHRIGWLDAPTDAAWNEKATLS